MAVKEIWQNRLKVLLIGIQPLLSHLPQLITMKVLAGVMLDTVAPTNKLLLLQKKPCPSLRTLTAGLRMTGYSLV
jgi:hypothetical protein